MPPDERERQYVQFITHFEGNIVKFCTDASDDSYDAQELMQEIFAALWEALPMLRPTSTRQQQNRWLYRVMQTTLIRHLRHRQHRYLTTTAMANTGDDTSQDLLAELLDDLCAELPSGERTIVNDTLKGYSISEMAKRHNTTTAGIKSRMTRIKKKLRKIYDRKYGKQ